MNRYELALQEVGSVLDEWLLTTMDRESITPLAATIVERLVAKGVIQSTDPDELRYRTGPLEPGRTTVGKGPREDEP